MRPQLLAVDGFGAFRDRVEIDFNGIDFFALVGPTGSGKSTVIDAICFALYGSVPRYNNESLVAPIISTGNSEARVSLTFSAGGSTYVATRVARRTPKGATTREARLERHEEDGTVVTLAASANDMTAAVQSLLGLSFAHFTRCVVLPQGEFAKFLHDKPSDRQEVLVKLLELEVYRKMMQAANARAAKAVADQQIIAAVIEELGDLSEETLAAVRRQHDRLGTLREWLDVANAAISDIATRGRAATEQGKMLSEQINLLSGLEVPANVHELTGNMARATASLNEAEAVLAESESAVETARLNLAKLPTLDALQGIVRDHNDLQRVTVELGEVSEQLAAAEAAVQAATEAVLGAEADTAAAKARLEPVHELESAEEAHRSLAHLQARLATNAASSATIEASLTDTMTRRTHGEREISRLTPLAAGVGPLTQLAAIHEELASKAHDLRNAQAHAEATESAAAEALDAANAASDARQRAADTVTAIERANAAAALAVTLQVGDQCPVCRHEITAIAEHPTIPELHEAQASLKQATAHEVTARTNLDAARTAALTAQAGVTSRQTRCRELSEELNRVAATAAGSTGIAEAEALRDRPDSANAALAGANAAQQDLLRIAAELADANAQHNRLELQLAALTTEAKSWTEQRTTLEAIVARFPDRVDLQARISRAQQTQVTVDQLEATLLNVRQAESAGKNTYTGLAAKTEALAGQRAVLDARCVNHPSLSEAIAQQEAVQQAVANFETAQVNARSAKEVCAQSKVEVQACAHEEQKAKTAFQEARDRVASLAPPPTVDTTLVGQWSDLVNWAGAKLADLTIKQAEIQLLHTELREAIGVKRNERVQRVTETLGQESLGQGTLGQETLGQAIALDISDVDLDRVMTTAIGATQTETNRIEGGRQRTADLRAQEKALLGQAEVARKLGQLLSAKQFEQWLVATALKSLTAAASEILERLSGHEFGLETTESNDFLVVDHHNADERRPVRTLSGGETFQASLALALALSQELGGLTAQPGRSLDSIFLDEGFGTLDPETLDMVAGTIESLGQDGRMVGIITHVRELAERVPVRFRVTKGERTSTIEMEGA